MKRNLLFVIMALFGALAVGALAFLSGGGSGGPRAVAGDREEPLNPAGAVTTQAQGTGRVQEDKSGSSRISISTPTASVRPGGRERLHY